MCACACVCMICILKLFPNSLSGETMGWILFCPHMERVEAEAAAFSLTPRSLNHMTTGIVFTKGVSHKGMRQSILHPRILLITFAIEYHRVEHQFVSLEPLLAQERQYLRNLVVRIATLHPDVVLVEKTVAGIALDLLLHAGIVVSQMVKPSVLQAVARATGAALITSVDRLSLSPALGTCARFDVRTFLTSRHQKSTYHYFSGCPAASTAGRTAVLHSPDPATLRTVKSLLLFLCKVAYSLQLECSLFHGLLVSASTDTLTLPGSSEPWGPGVARGEDVPADHLADAMCALLRAGRWQEACDLFPRLFLHSSPGIRFPVPLMMTEAARNAPPSLGEGEGEGQEEAPGDSMQQLSRRVLAGHFAAHPETFTLLGYQSLRVLAIHSPSPDAASCVVREEHFDPHADDPCSMLGNRLGQGRGGFCPGRGCSRPSTPHATSYVHGTMQVIVAPVSPEVEVKATPTSGSSATLRLSCSACEWSSAPKELDPSYLKLPLGKWPSMMSWM